MRRNIFVNVNADSPSRALVRSVSNNQSAKLSDCVLNDTGSYAIFLVDGAGAYATESGSTGSYSLKAGVGNPGATPTDGSWWAAGPNLTNNIAWNATAAQVQTAFAAFATVEVTGTWPVLVVEWVGTAANTDVALISACGTNLLPHGSAVYVDEIQAGDATQNERQLLRLYAPPLAEQANWQQTSLYDAAGTHLADGWHGTVAWTTFGVHAALPSTSAVTRSFEVELTETLTSHRQTVAQQDVVFRPQVIWP